MLKLLIPICFILLNAYGLSAQNPVAEQSTFKQLLTINSQWLEHQEKAPKGSIKFNSDKERIALHLQLVAEALQQVETTGLSTKQRQKRADLIDTLKTYAGQGIFPINSFHRERRPYFIDIYNTHCAVGYLMKASEHEQLAINIQEQHNYDYIKDIRTPGVVTWAAEHGFSLQELAWIQPTYGGDEEPIRVSNPPIGRVHGSVKQKYYHEYKGVLGTVALGDFDTVWNDDGTWQLSNGFAFFGNGKWQCIGNELQGTIKRMHYTGLEAIFIEGSFLNKGQQFDMVLLDPTLGWQFPLGDNEDVWSAKRFTYTSLGELHYFGYYRDLGKGTYLMAIEGNGKVNLVGFVAGHVHSLSVEASPSSQYTSAHNICIAGNFDSLSFTAYRKGNGVSWIQSKNMVIAQLTEPIKVSQKKEPEMYLVDTAFEYDAILFKNTAHGSIVQSVLKKGYVYSLGFCGDSTETRACITAYHTSQPLKPLLSKRAHASVKRPFRFNDQVYFDGKRLRIKD